MCPRWRKELFLSTMVDCYVRRNGNVTRVLVRNTITLVLFVEANMLLHDVIGFGVLYLHWFVMSVM